MKPYFMPQPLSSEPQGTAHSPQKHDRYARDQHRIHPCAPASSSMGGARAGATLTSAGGRSCCDIQGCDFSAVRPEPEPRQDSGRKGSPRSRVRGSAVQQAVLEGLEPRPSAGRAEDCGDHSASGSSAGPVRQVTRSASRPEKLPVSWVRPASSQCRSSGTAPCAQERRKRVATSMSSKGVSSWSGRPHMRARASCSAAGEPVSTGRCAASASASRRGVAPSWRISLIWQVSRIQLAARARSARAGACIRTAVSRSSIEVPVCAGPVGSAASRQPPVR